MTARGIVTGVAEDGMRTLATCEVWLEHELRGRLLAGEAVVAIESSAGTRSIAPPGSGAR